jgi:hypothetical protein
VVKPIRETNVEVAPIKGKVIQKQITTKRRSAEKELTEVLSPLRGRKITKTTTSSRTSSRRSGSASSSTEDVVSPTRGSTSDDEVMSPIRRGTVTKTTRGSSRRNSRT